MTSYVAFAAYKGGVGRTTALVSVANALVRCGRSVLVVDLDIEAPSIATHFGHEIWQSKGAGWNGVVPWVMADVRFGAGISASDREALDIDELADEPDIERHLIDVGPRDGSLRILAAGPIGVPYLDAILDEHWRSAFDENGVPFVERLKAAIEAITDPPDVVLIDARAGLNPVTGALAVNPDVRTAYFFGGDVDSLEVGETIRMRAEKSSEDFVHVLSRYPTFMGQPYQDLLTDLERYLDEDLPLFTISGAPGREGRSDAVIGLDHVDEASPLAASHARLMLRLFPDEHALDGDDEMRKLLHRATFEPDGGYKIFRLLATGHMSNPSDGKRNVAFKVDTLASVFEKISETLRQKRRLGVPISAERVEEALRAGGEVAGSAFGETFVETRTDETIEDRLRAWCEFDADVGFGTLEFERPEPDRYEVRLAEAFLSRDHPAGANVLAGYVQGVMEQLVLPQERRGVPEVRWEPNGTEIVATVSLTEPAT